MMIWWKIYRYFERKYNIVGEFVFKHKVWKIYFKRNDKYRCCFHVRHGLTHYIISMEEPQYIGRKPKKFFFYHLMDFFDMEIKNNSIAKNRWEWLKFCYNHTGSPENDLEAKKLNMPNYEVLENEV